MNSTLLSDNFDYIAEQIRFYKFSPPLNYDCCVAFVLKRLDKKVFDESKSSIKTFLSRYIKYYVYNYFRDNKQQPIITDPNILEEIVPDTYKLNSHVNYEVNIDTDINYRSPETDYWKERKEHEIACAINELSSKHRNIILLYFYDCKTEREIGEMFGVTKQAICQQIKKAESILKPKIKQRLDELDRIKGEL